MTIRKIRLPHLSIASNLPPPPTQPLWVEGAKYEFPQLLEYSFLLSRLRLKEIQLFVAVVLSSI